MALGLSARAPTGVSRQSTQNKNRLARQTTNKSGGATTP